MVDKKNPLGATGETVSRNVQRLRKDRNLGFAELARRLKAAGRSIPELGLRRIEEGERRVDSDDLVALAVAFEVSPITLLMPPTTDPTDAVSVAAGPLTAQEFWRWLAAEKPMSGGSALEVFNFVSRSIPAWLIGTEYALAESGTTPNRTYSLLRHVPELKQDADGNN